MTLKFYHISFYFDLCRTLTLHPPTFQTILTLISLQPFTPADFDRLKQWVNSEELLVQFAGPIFRYPLTDEQLHEYVAEPQRRAFRVLHGERVIGHAEVMLTEGGTAKLCRILIGDEANRGRGWGEQIIRALVDVSRQKYDAKTVELNVYNWNKGAMRCYEKVGFVENPEGQWTTRVDGQTWTAVNMVLA